MNRKLRLIVGPARVTADAGSGDARCLRVQRAGSDEWEIFYDEIHGFEYVPGFRYELEVAVSEVDTPIPDGSSLRYDLVRILERRPDSD